MNFTYDGYRFLLELLIEYGYRFVGYDEYEEVSSCIIMRHDIDQSLEKALEVSKIEYALRNKATVKSTFCIMVSNELYNPFTLKAKKIVEEIQQHGNEIGLHFSEYRYPELQKSELIDKILIEADMLGKAIGTNIKCVSLDSPSQELINEQLKIPKMINAYSTEFFKVFKYLSDSNMHWREPVEEYIRTKKYKRMQILTHPFWYSKKAMNIHDTLEKFINCANYERYEVFRRYGFRSFAEIFGEDEVR